MSARFGPAEREALRTKLATADEATLRGIANDLLDAMDNQSECTDDALRDCQQRYTTLTDMLPLCVFEADENLIFTFLNDYGKAALGISDEDMRQGFCILRLLDEENRIRLRENTLRILEDKSFEGHLYNAHTTSGQRIDAIIYSIPKFEKGKLIGWTGVATDVTAMQIAQDEIHQHRELLNSIISQLPVGVFVKDAVSLKYRLWNHQMAEISGIPADEVIGHTDREIHTNEQAQRFMATDEALLRGNKQLSPTEYPTESRKGPCIVRAQKMLLRDRRQNPELIVGILEDVTHLRHQEQEARENARLFETVVEKLPVGIVLVNLNKQVQVWNGAQEELSGIAREHAVGRPLFELMPNLPTSELKQAYEAIATNGQPVFLFHLPFYRQPPNSEACWLNYLIVPHYDQHGKLVGFLQTTEDTTRTHLAQDTILEQKQLLDTIIENLPVGVFAKDVQDDYRFVLWNRQMERIIGFKTEEVIGKSDYELVEHELADSYRRDDVEVMRRGEMLDIAEEPVVTEHSSLTVHTTKLPLKDTMGRPHLMLGILEDITTRKKLEEERVKLQKLESLSVLAGGIAHDFNNILMSLLGNVGMLKMNLSPPDENLVFVEEAESAITRAKSLTMQLLTFAKGGAPIRETASMAEIVKESTTFVLRGSNVSCEFHFPKDLWSVQVDKGQISQVVQNIVINADNAMPGGGGIVIEASNQTLQHGLAEIRGDEKDDRAHQRFVRIRFVDNGHGIPQDYLHRIFDPYFSTKQTGHGLGLAVVYSIVKRHEGHITVESTIGRGSTFTIWLPADERPKQPEARQLRFVRGSGRILALDDDKNIRLMLSKLMPKLGYSMVAVESGEKAIEEFRKAHEANEPFDLVILDLTIPGGMGGVKVLEQLKTIQPDVKAVASSGYANDDVMTDPTAYGFVDVLPKPFELVKLSHIMHKVTGGRP